MKKLTALFMALVMMMAMATTASAATTTITIVNAAPDGTYKAYKVMNVEGSATAIRYKTNAKWETFVDDYATLDVDGKGYVTEMAGFVMATFADAVLTAGLTEDATGTGGTIDLDDGYWVMSSPTGNAPFAFTVINNEIVTDIIGWSTDTIKEKSGLPTIDKTVDKTTACIGEELTYTITVKAAAGTDAYTITDDVPAGITIKSIKSVDGAIGTPVVDYVNNTITLTIDSAERATMADNYKIEIVYTAELDKDAEIDGPGNTNKVTLNYGDNLKKTDFVTVHTYQLIINKTDDGGNALKDAEFKLKNGTGEYAVVTDGFISGWSAEGSVLKTAADGVIKFVGLGNGDYVIVEFAPPPGYIKADDKPVEINGADVTETIVNAAGQRLPETGGMGTTVFTLSGVMLMLAGAVVLSKKRRLA